ncbi:MAG TPA: TetR/AcrR family transcriptional regulator [Puia sp.]|jgi:AcrR family transcriptional regulator
MRVRDESKVEAIYQQALKMIVAEGFDGLSMQKLARAAGVSPATIYIYFKDRDDLLLQLYQLEVDKYFAYVLRGFDPEMDFATGLSVQWKNRAQYIVDHPDKAHFMEHFKFTPLHDKVMVNKNKPFLDAMHRFVEKAIENKELIQMSPEVYWSIAFAPLFNLMQWNKAGKSIGGRPFSLTDEMLHQTLALVLKALRP